MTSQALPGILMNQWSISHISIDVNNLTQYSLGWFLTELMWFPLVFLGKTCWFAWHSSAKKWPGQRKLTVKATLVHCVVLLSLQPVGCDARERSLGTGESRHPINHPPPTWVGIFLSERDLPTVCPNHFSSQFYCALQNMYLVLHFHSKRWLGNKCFSLIWEETCQIINKHKKTVILDLQLGWAVRFRGKL